jgi:hypothetical protein
VHARIIFNRIAQSYEFARANFNSLLTLRVYCIYKDCVRCSDAGGGRAAAIYSLLGTAKLNGLDSKLYLREVLACIAVHLINRVDELLPWNLLQGHGNVRLAA